MTKFQYEILQPMPVFTPEGAISHSEGPTLDDVNKLADSGWRLVAAVPTEAPNMAIGLPMTFFFEREKA